MFVQRFGASASGNRAQCERDDDRVIGIPADRNEIGDRIDGKSEVNEQQQQANANAERQIWVGGQPSQQHDGIG